MSEQQTPTALNGTAPKALSALIDNVDVVIESFLGSTLMTIAALHALKIGAVIELDASLADTVDLRVNGISIASGELVAVGDKFGVRITAVAS